MQLRFAGSVHLRSAQWGRSSHVSVTLPHSYQEEEEEEEEEEDDEEDDE